MRLFINYHESDELYYKALVKQLKSPGVASKLSFFEPAPGADWIKEGETYIKECHIVLCLISSDALLDDTFNDFAELAATYKKSIIPIIIRECLWKYNVFSGKKSLPSNNKVLAEFSPAQLDNIIVNEILKPILENIEKNEKTEVDGERETEAGEPPNPENKKPADRTDFFICYAAEDIDYVAGIRDFMEPLKQKGVKNFIEVPIGIGSNWEEIVNQNIEKSFLAVLLTSPQLLNSDFIKSQTLKNIKSDKIRTLLLHVETSLWKNVLEVRNIQSSNTSRRTIAKLKQEKNKEGIKEIYLHLSELIEIAKEDF